jgi:hypothetical protein
MAASIFNNTAVKILKNILRFKSLVEIITGDTDNPTSVAKNAPIGSIYIRSGTSEIYKKTDSGSSTNWTTVGSADVFSTSSISTNTSAAANTTYLVNTGAAVTVTLPAPAANRYVAIKDRTGTARAFNITVARNAAESIEGVAASYVMNSDFDAAIFVSDGTNWFRL